MAKNNKIRFQQGTAWTIENGKRKNVEGIEAPILGDCCKLDCCKKAITYTSDV